MPPLGCLQSATLGPPTCPEQSGILDWLRKLRLHKYYPVFKQLTMEEVGGARENSGRGLGLGGWNTGIRGLGL